MAGKIRGNIAEQAAGELPPFIGQRELPLFQQCINKMAGEGINKWVLNNVSQFGLFEGMDCELSAGPFLYTWNAYAAAFLSDLGVKYFTASWEDDFLNIRKMSGPGLGRYIVVYLYGFAPVVRSRMITKEMLTEDAVKDCSSAHDESDGTTFTPVFESGLALLVPEKPVSIFTARRKFKEIGISNFGIDLCFIKPGRQRWDAVINSYNTSENAPGTVKFNFKRLVK